MPLIVHAPVQVANNLARYRAFLPDSVAPSSLSRAGSPILGEQVFFLERFKLGHRSSVISGASTNKSSLLRHRLTKKGSMRIPPADHRSPRASLHPIGTPEPQAPPFRVSVHPTDFPEAIPAYQRDMSSNDVTHMLSPLEVGLAARPVAMLVVRLAGLRDRIASGNVVELVSEHTVFLETVHRITAEERGTIVSFSTVVLVVWNVTRVCAQREMRAVTAAMRIQAELERRKMAVWMGLHSGTALVGHLGCRDLMRLCVLGTVVRTAHLLEQLAEHYRPMSGLVLTQEIAREVETRFLCCPIDVLQCDDLPGTPKLMLLQVHSLSSPSHACPPPPKSWSKAVGEVTLQVDTPIRCGRFPHRRKGVSTWTHMANGHGHCPPVCGLTQRSETGTLHWHN